LSNPCAHNIGEGDGSGVDNARVATGRAEDVCKGEGDGVVEEKSDPKKAITAAARS
jgi:hypothetical protein